MNDEDKRLAETHIRALLRDFAAAFRARDIDGVMPLFAPTIVSFDLAPPLQCTGADALRKHWQTTFAAIEGSVDYEIHELAIEVGDGLAFSRSLNWMRGTLADGCIAERWLRWTACFRRVDGQWRITHEHVSVPIEVASGKALTDLPPPWRSRAGPRGSGRE